jgi:hypothetical protein
MKADIGVELLVENSISHAFQRDFVFSRKCNSWTTQSIMTLIASLNNRLSGLLDTKKSEQKEARLVANQALKVS